MSRILIWTEAHINGLREAWGMDRVLTEVAEDGTVTREIGFDTEGKLVHRYPGVPTLAEYGVFDLARVAPSDCAEMDAAEFERLWSS